MIDEKRLIKDLESFTKDEGSLAIYGTKLKSIIYDCIIEVEKQPKIGEWVPYSEQLPEAGKRYLVTAVWKDGDFETTAVYDAVYGSDGIWHVKDYAPAPYEVIAWQPLPEPYKS